DLIRGEGFALHPLRWRRGSINLFGAFASVREVANLYRRARPDIVHHVSQKPILIGSVAARLARVPRVVNALTGLGFLFAASTVKARILRAILVPALRNVAARPGVRFLVENPDDGATLRRLDMVPADRIVLIKGSGVDVGHYEALPAPAAGQVVIGCATRMLRIKGVRDVVAAFRLLRARGSSARLLLAGASDPENHAAIPEAELRAWGNEPGIAWLGHVPDIREVWERAHIAVLASLGGEGIPMSLMEAAACGRPLVATDVPGCREIVVPGETGLLVPPGDPASLANALQAMTESAELRQRCGAAARERVTNGLDAGTVGRETVAVYRDLLKGGRDLLTAGQNPSQ
ncbi:MAG: glycosyl transferase family 1, partial [Rhodospirillales bacterium]|nr:glycosyl transferase family 1 [Rhodospirillales bacterium]